MTKIPRDINIVTDGESAGAIVDDSGKDSRRKAAVRVVAVGDRLYRLDEYGIGIATRKGQFEVAYEDVAYIIPEDCVLASGAPLFLHLISENGSHHCINFPIDYVTLQFVRDLIERCYSAGVDLKQNIKRAALSLWQVEKAVELINAQFKGDKKQIADLIDGIILEAIALKKELQEEES